MMPAGQAHISIPAAVIWGPDYGRSVTVRGRAANQDRS